VRPALAMLLNLLFVMIVGWSTFCHPLQNLPLVKLGDWRSFATCVYLSLVKGWFCPRLCHTPTTAPRQGCWLALLMTCLWTCPLGPKAARMAFGWLHDLASVVLPGTSKHAISHKKIV
jgi:hypothetical protein